MARSQLYLSNAFSANMIPREDRIYRFLILAPFEAAAILYVLRDRVTNIIGHADTAAVAEQVLRAQVPALELPEPQRLTVQLAAADEVLVAQYTGPRLPEGTTQLPEGARLEFRLVVPNNFVRLWVTHGVIDRYRYVHALPFLQRLQCAVDEYVRWCSINENVRAVELLETMRWLKEVDGIEYPS